MAEGFQLKAAVRERTGKGAARALRRQGMIPAVIYGDNKPPIPIAVPYKEVALALYGGGFHTNTWDIDVEGQKIQVLARDYQLEPVKDFVDLVDFLRVTARSRVAVDVPITIVGEDESPGVTQDGVVNLVSHTVTVEAPATRIPDAIEVSVAGLEIGATIHSSDITLPPEVKFVTEEAFAIATITGPVAEEAPEEAEAAEGGEEAPGGEGEGEG
jgi:large subunit ribosomal protein L25